MAIGDEGAWKAEENEKTKEEVEKGYEEELRKEGPLNQFYLATTEITGKK